MEKEYYSMVAKEVTMVRLTLNKIVCDPVQYKPYSPEFTLQDVIVEIPLDSDLVELDEDQLVLQLEGMQALLAKVANAVEDMHSTRQAGQRSRLEGEETSRRSYSSRRSNS
jgi:hypothetical protein